MMIKTGKHIDANGKIYLPYLHEWKHVSSNSFNPCLKTRFKVLKACSVTARVSAHKNVAQKIC